ncbi:hypothetical protein HZ326_25054 [Fusarium oxysporum f. sp. albedinis]|nr:Uncharacterized protein HZ326_27786 [Fusarium oxysporum f. sp. albedinis]KAJ0131855.1 hypothetical protein HZ326_25054 [Fusarium oxysporum f. sp. albedinis]
MTFSQRTAGTHVRRDRLQILIGLNSSEFQSHIARSSTAVDDCAVWLFYALSVTYIHSKDVSSRSDSSSCRKDGGAMRGFPNGPRRNR